MSGETCYARNIRFLPAAEVRQMSVQGFHRYIEYLFERNSIHAADALAFLDRVEYIAVGSADAVADSAPTLLHIFIQSYAYDGIVDFVTSIRIFVGAIPGAPRQSEVGFWNLYSSIQTATFLMFHIRAALTVRAPTIRALPATAGGFRQFDADAIYRRLVEKFTQYHRRVQFQMELEGYYSDRYKVAEGRVTAYLRKMEEIQGLLYRILRLMPRRRSAADPARL